MGERAFEMVGGVLNASFVDPVSELKNLVLGTVKEDITIDEIELIARAIAKVNKMELDEQQMSAAISQIQEHQLWRMDLGIELVAKEHQPWLDERKDQIDWQRWSLFYSYLKKSTGINSSVLKAMDQRSDKILDLTGDPLASGSWSRKGLVIGEVQSGKTQNYLALFNKAADAGYKIFILLAGDKERLRSQTQERIDSGFLGRDTKLLSGVDQSVLLSHAPIGLATIDQQFQHPTSLTTFWQDFRVGSTNQLQNLNDGTIPHVFVVKKNKSVLENLAKFLGASASTSGKIKSPLLLLDDEADYASINTSSPETDPTAINQAIRNLIDVFEKSSYVGFTATPFANVLISDEDETDLFPRDFIFYLESPSNYFGPRQLFDETSSDQGTVVPLSDTESNFPAKHRKTLRVEVIPDSLRRAVLAFYISNAIRDIRPGQSSEPRSMMIHVSRFKNVHSQLFGLISDLCADLDATLSLGIGSAELLKEMQGVFLEHFSHVQESWQEVSKQLGRVKQSVEVYIVNSDKGNRGWLTAYDSDSPRVIAIGGDLLSRGLTLNGLAVSYFYRRSLAYDTVMQMGRWFGYRDGYRDCCKVFIDLEVAEWFRDISDALEELRVQLIQMQLNNQTPQTFGLAVRCHPGSVLTVTALNKLRSGEKRAMSVSLWGTNNQSTRFTRDQKTLTANLQAGEELVTQLRRSNYSPLETTSKESWTEVERGHVIDFFQKFRVDQSDKKFGSNGFLRFISNALEDRLEKWDVIIQSGDGSEVSFAGKGVKPVLRGFYESPVDPNVMVVNRGKQSISGSADLALAIADAGSKKSSNLLTPLLKRPLLVVYPVQVEIKEERDIGPKDFNGLIIGVSAAFPIIDNGETRDELRVDYFVNTVWQKQNALFELTDFEEEDVE